MRIDKTHQPTHHRRGGRGAVLAPYVAVDLDVVVVCEGSNVRVTSPRRIVDPLVEVDLWQVGLDCSILVCWPVCNIGEGLQCLDAIYSATR